MTKPRTENQIMAAAYISAAEVFEVYASDQLASRRFQSGKRAQHECAIRAAVWTDAAAELRKAATTEPTP